jgi:ABC-type antimicrobial peptide transport system permease subunit
MGEPRSDIKRVSFTLTDAFRMGYEHIRRGIDRAAINIASIALGISFLSSLTLTDAFYRASARSGGASIGVESYQYWLVFVALAVCMVGIVNAMLIAVYERYKEIGTMKCLGALDRHILMIFMAESFLQGFVGGALGVTIGLLTALLSVGFAVGFDIMTKVPALELVILLGGSALLSILLSAASTIYPAFRAARLKPVEALSHEL